MKPKHILVVDDDRVNLRILAGILRGEGYVLAEASSGEQALESYAAKAPDRRQRRHRHRHPRPPVSSPTRRRRTTCRGRRRPPT